ncbi:MAG TPA: hypothetical protein VK137_17365 [Planctomycetaceae bacterium]|nr:hypothetical protein [Planctomycetaceae bacterium]
MEIRTVLSSANLTAQMLGVVAPTSTEVASTNLTVMNAKDTEGGLSHKPEQAAKEQAVTQELDRAHGQGSVAAFQVSIEVPAVAISLHEIGSGHDFENDGVLSHGRAAIHDAFTAMDFDPLTWSISFFTTSSRGSGNSLRELNVTASLFMGELSLEAHMVATFSFGMVTRPNGHVTTAASDLETPTHLAAASGLVGTGVSSDSHLETGSADVLARSSGLPRAASETLASAPSSPGIFTELSSSRFLVSEQTSRRRDPDDLRIPTDRMTMARFLETLTPRRPNRLIDGPIGDRDSRDVRRFELRTVQPALPASIPVTLPTWDSELLAREKPTQPDQPAEPAQPNQSDKNSADEKKTPNGKVQDEKTRDGSNQNKPTRTDEQKDTGTEAESNAADAPMSAAPRSRFSHMRAFLSARHSRANDPTLTQTEPSDDSASRSWWESCMDPTAWLAGILSLSSFAAVWQDDRKRDVTDDSRQMRLYSRFRRTR